MDQRTYKTGFKVIIPNLEGDGIFEEILIWVDVYKEGFPPYAEILTPLSTAMIDLTKARRMIELRDAEIARLRSELRKANPFNIHAFGVNPTVE